MLYQDFTYRNAHTTTPTQTGAPFSAAQIMLPLLPLTLGELNVWAAVMSVFLLTASEFASPLYNRSGFGMLIDRKRLRLAALVLAALFLITTVYQLIPLQAAH